MPDDHAERLTILERAQLLHDATLRRHGEMLDQHAVEMAALRDIQERQQRLMETLADVSARLETTLQAIKDLLDRGNGRC